MYFPRKLLDSERLCSLECVFLKHLVFIASESVKWEHDSIIRWCFTALENTNMLSYNYRN
jgi:hypothetical protein